MARPTEAFVRCLAAERIRRGLIQLDANVPGWMAGVKLHSTLPRWPVPVRRIISSQATSALLEGINALYDGMTYLGSMNPIEGWTRYHRSDDVL